MNKGNLIIMCGVPGSGKTHYSKEIMENIQDDSFVYLSSDDIRVELFGFEDQTKHKETFAEMNKRCKEYLSQGKSVVYDATSLTRKLRTNLINEMKEVTYKVIIYACIVDFKLLKEINGTRVERKLPENKLKQMYLSYELPDPMLEEFYKCVVHKLSKSKTGNLYSYNLTEMYGDDWKKSYEI